MAHHGWVDIINPKTLAPEGLKAPFGRLFASEDHQYNSLAISLFAGPMGPLHTLPTTPSVQKAANFTGFTFFGQFVDHDLTEFRVIGHDLSIIPQNPTIGQRQIVLEDLRNPKEQLPTTTNGRSGKLDLDSVYGLLGAPQPELYDKDGLFLLYQPDVSSTPSNYVHNPHVIPDIWRGNGFRNKRLIADPRNDENKLIVQIHMLFQRLHNTIHLAKTATPRGPTSSPFKATRQEVEDTYRRIVLFDYLPRIVQPAQIVAVLQAFERKSTFFQQMNARNDAILRELGVDEAVVTQAVSIPVEFSHAVFRLGHTQLRNGYLLRTGFPSLLFDTSRQGFDLRGDQPLLSVVLDKTSGALLVRDFHVDWSLFFKSGANTPEHGEAIDGHLPPSIFRLPPPSIGEPPQSLAERNIRRGVDFGLPSGQSVVGQLARLYGYIPPLGRQELFPPVDYDLVEELFALEPSLLWNTPLWYYILQEAAAIPIPAGTTKSPPQLGAAGGYIVAETILGALLEAAVAVPGGSPSAGHGVGAGSGVSQDPREDAIATLAGILLQEFQKIAPSGEMTDEEKPSSPLYWKKQIAGTADIYTMGQLVGYVTQGQISPVPSDPCASPPPTSKKAVADIGKQRKSRQQATSQQ